MSYLVKQFRSYFKRAKDFCVYKILHADDPPHTLALGIAVGMFVTFLPLIGFQMMISFFLAWMLKANKVVGVPIVWISNPLTLVPIYYPCYVVGCKILGLEVVADKWDEISASWEMLRTDATAQWMDKVRFWWDILVDSLAPLSVGCLLVATIASVVSYYVSLVAIRQYRLRRWGQLMPPVTTPTESIEDDAIAMKASSPESSRTTEENGETAA